MISQAYRPIYKVRSFVKQQIKPEDIAYNIIKFGTIGLGLFGVYWITKNL